MAIVNTQVLAGDATFSLANGATAGRMLLVIATQHRSPANLGGFSYNSVAGTVYGLQTASSGNRRSLCTLWTDSELPASPGTYAIERDSSVAGNTDYVVIELSGMDENAAPEVLSGAPISGLDPFTVQFSNSGSAFLAMGFIIDGVQAGNMSAGVGQTLHYGDNIELATSFSTTSANDSLEVNNYSNADPFAYSAIALAEITGPQLSVVDPIIPGATTTISSSGNVDPWTGARITDSAGNVKEITLASQTSVSAPAVGNLDYVLYGDVTLEVYNATESATTTVAFNQPAGFSLVELASGFVTTPESYLHNYGGTPAVGDQFAWNPIASDTGETLTLGSDGLWTSTGDGTWLIYGTDASDGQMQSFPLISGPGTGIISVNGGAPLVAGQAFNIEVLDINANDIRSAVIDDGNTTWTIGVDEVVDSTNLTVTAPADLPSGGSFTVRVNESKDARLSREAIAGVEEVLSHELALLNGWTQSGTPLTIWREGGFGFLSGLVISGTAAETTQISDVLADEFLPKDSEDFYGYDSSNGEPIRLTISNANGAIYIANLHGVSSASVGGLYIKAFFRLKN